MPILYYAENILNYDVVVSVKDTLVALIVTIDVVVQEVNND